MEVTILIFQKYHNQYLDHPELFQKLKDIFFIHQK